MKLFNLLVALCAVVSLVACSEEDNEEIEMTNPGTVTLMFDNIAGDSDLTFVEDASTTYNLENALEQDFNVDLIGYYISEIKLTGMEGTADYTDVVDYSAETPLGFYLVEETVDGISGNMISLSDVPVGHYTAVTFTLGVSMDYLSEGAQGGVLSSENGYVWSWNSGYVGYKMEGAAAEGLSGEEQGTDISLAYHVGGEGVDADDVEFSNIKTITLELDTHVMIENETQSTVMIDADALATLSGHMDVDFTVLPTAHAPSASQHIGHNLTSAFSISTVENDVESTHSHE